MREVGLRSDRMVTDSHASRIDVMKHLEIDLSRQDRVRVIPCGVSQRFEPPNRALPPDPSRPRRLLYVGRSDPYKNLSGLVRAFGRAKSRCPFPITLTIAGPRDARYPEASECISQLGLGDAVQWSGYVGDDDLVALYQRSDLLVHASMYEGFGLPIVEAMACGVPVVCSKSGSLPEVAGDAAFLLDWDDTDGFARAIHDVLVHPDLARRMSDEGRRRAAQFTWRRTAEETLALYREFAPNRT